jgi:hypothetical protein
VKFSPGLKLVLATALVLTLGTKAIWTRDAPQPDAALFSDRAETLLRIAGFDTSRIVRPFATLLLGRKGACAMMIGEYPPNGAFADILSFQTRGIGPLRYVWRGGITERPPRIIPLAWYFIERELRRIGFSPSRDPIVAFAASPACEPGSIDWNALATLPR